MFVLGIRIEMLMLLVMFIHKLKKEAVLVLWGSRVVENLLFLDCCWDSTCQPKEEY